MLFDPERPLNPGGAEFTQNPQSPVTVPLPPRKALGPLKLNPMVPIALKSLGFVTSAVPVVILKVGMLSAWAGIAQPKNTLRRLTNRSFRMQQPRGRAVRVKQSPPVWHCPQ